MSTDSKKKEILPEYKPIEWEEFIRTHYAEKFEESSRKLQLLEELGEQEADRKLMDMVLKSSLIDRFLALFGEQTPEELFNKIGEVVEENPFSSSADLKGFAEQMSHMFLIRESNKKMRNSGLGYRRFCQYIRERIEMGDVVNEETIRKILDDFYSTIEVQPDASYNMFVFKKREVLLDLHNLKRFAKTTQGFSYNSGTLSYSSQIHLSLVLPILVYTVDTDNFLRVDKSRIVSGRVKVQYAVITIVIVAEMMGDIPMLCTIFTKKIDIGKQKPSTVLQAIFYHIKGYVKPNGKEQVNVFEFTEIEHPVAPSLCTPSRKIVERFGEKDSVAANYGSLVEEMPKRKTWKSLQ